jgi:hypothetical protein
LVFKYSNSIWIKFRTNSVLCIHIVALVFVWLVLEFCKTKVPKTTPNLSLFSLSAQPAPFFLLYLILARRRPLPTWPSSTCHWPSSSPSLSHPPHHTSPTASIKCHSPRHTHLSPLHWARHKCPGALLQAMAPQSLHSTPLPELHHRRAHPFLTV